MADLPTLRKHEAALLRLFNRHAFTEDEAALDYALTLVREQIASVETYEAMVAAQCPSCRGSGTEFSWSSLSDERECRACKGTGRRPHV